MAKEQEKKPVVVTKPTKVIPPRPYVLDELSRVKNKIPKDTFNKQTSNEKNK